MYLTFLLARLVRAALLLIAAAVSKLFSEFASSRKALVDYGVPNWLAAPITMALPCTDLIIPCLLIPAGSARIGAVSALRCDSSFMPQFKRPFLRLKIESPIQKKTKEINPWTKDKRFWQFSRCC